MGVQADDIGRKLQGGLGYHHRVSLKHLSFFFSRTALMQVYPENQTFAEY